MNDPSTTAAQPGPEMTTGGMTLRDLVGRYVADRKVGEGTERGVRAAVKQLDRWHGQHVRPEQLSTELLDTFIASRFTSGKGSRTLKKERGILVTLWNYAIEYGIVAEEHPEEAASIGATTCRYDVLRNDEFSRLLDACSTEKSIGAFGPAHWRGLIRLVNETSVQVGRVLRLKKGAVDLARGTICIPNAQPRYGGATVFRLAPETAACLSKIAKGRAMSPLFPWPFIASDTLRRHFRRILARAGLPTDRNSVFQRLARRRQPSETIDTVEEGAPCRR